MRTVLRQQLRHDAFDLRLGHIDRAVDVYEKAHPDANVLWGSSVDESLKDEVVEASAGALTPDEPPGSPRMAGTWRRVRERLSPAEGLLYRYEPSLAAGEGAFGICLSHRPQLCGSSSGSTKNQRKSCTSSGMLRNSST